MTTDNSLAARQYELVRQARAVLLDYCATLAPAHFVAPVPAFGGSSIRNLLAHVAGCYGIWLGRTGLGRDYAPPAPADVPDVAALRQLFGQADVLVAEFGQRYGGEWLVVQPWQIRRQPEPLLLTPWQLFTHGITHEFHHKGQVLTMSRLLGYSPVDTDIIRT